MRPLIVKWGKFKIELPTEVFLIVLFNTFPTLHKLNV
jgi:hypothetical protein